MVTKNSAKQPSRYKPLLMVVAFLVTLYVLFTGIVLASNWYKIRPYKVVANEVNTALGGGYRISYNWNCGLETSNCPSARMIKDANFKDNEEAKALLTSYKEVLAKNGFEDFGFGICGAQNGGVNVYCTIEGKKSSKVITINTKKDFIGIDIQR